MKKFLFTILYIFTFFISFCQGDGTMWFSTNLTANPNEIEVKLHSSVAYSSGSSVTFEVDLPPMTSIATFTPVLAGVSSQGTNTYGSVAGLPGIAASGEIVLARFTWTSTNTGTGTFGIENNANNYIEYGDPALERQGVPVNNVGTIPLPIKLRYFSAVKDGDRASRLDWTSSSEINSDFFDIERSQDGQSWENIGQVQAAGISNTDIAYQYFDRKLPKFRTGKNIFYYRLKMLDQDGKFNYSDIRGVNFDKTSESIISIYPNPTTDFINVDLSGMILEDGDVSLTVFDMNGRAMISKNILGNGIELIDVDQIPSGTYNVLVQQGDYIHQKKIIKID